MPMLSSFLLGSLSTILALKIVKVTKRILPYYGPISKFIQKKEKEQIKRKRKRIAIIIGATDGIGKQYSKFMNNHQYQLYLIGRNNQKLMAIQQQIKVQNSNKTFSQIDRKSNFYSNVNSIYQIDFSQTNFQELKQKIEKLAQSILKDKCCDDSITKIQLGVINCVGEAHINRYNQMQLTQINKLNSVNLNSLHFGLNLIFLLNQELQKKQEKVCKQLFFINISSMVGQTPNPYSSIYSACKSYQSNIMKTLSLQKKQQIKSHNIDFLNIKPWYVSTKMVRFMKKWDSVEPIDVVQGSFKVLHKKEEAAGCIKHQLLYSFSKLVDHLIKNRSIKAIQIADKIIELRKARKNRQKQ